MSQAQALRQLAEGIAERHEAAARELARMAADARSRAGALASAPSQRDAPAASRALPEALAALPPPPAAAAAPSRKPGQGRPLLAAARSPASLQRAARIEPSAASPEAAPEQPPSFVAPAVSHGSDIVERDPEEISPAKRWEPRLLENRETGSLAAAGRPLPETAGSRLREELRRRLLAGKEAAKQAPEAERGPESGAQAAVEDVIQERKAALAASSGAGSGPASAEPAFTMDGSETSAAIRRLSGELESRGTHEVLSADSSALFARIRAAHLRWRKSGG